MEFDENLLKDPPYEYITTQQRANEVCENELKKADIVAVDTEGTALDPFSSTLLLFQIADKNKAYIFDARKIKDFSPVKKILEDSKKLKLTQNGKFDYEVLKVSLGIAMRNIYDTMLAEALLNAGLSSNARLSSLKLLAKKYLDVDLKKEIRESFVTGGRITKGQLEYAAMDVLVLFPIFDKQYAKIKAESLTKTAKLEFAVLPVVGEMELRGININAEKWRRNLQGLKEKRDLLAQQIQNEVRPLYKNSQADLFGNMGNVINLNSQKQLLELFNDKLGLDFPSTGVAVLQKFPHPVAKMLLEYRGYEKLLSAFGENMLSKLNKKTKKLHPDFFQLGAATGRFSCSNPNLQQIPRDATFRSCFSASKGYKLVNADYSQAELRILAEYSKDPVFVRAYKENADLHTITASQMYNVPFDKVTKEMRQATKTINFGLMYGRGAVSIGMQIGISSDEAKKLLDKYFSIYAGVKKWLDKAARTAVQKGYAETILGRKRWFVLPDKADPNYIREIGSIERAAKNHPIQGTSADMTKLALVFIQERFEKEGIKGGIVHTVHDEIVSEVVEEQAEFAAKIQQEEMERAGKTFLREVPVVAEVTVSDVWEH
ncbi:hypothetical protein COT69_03135 [candidate division WWE3 bacterium CG09_land_8_20_14_0_10_39_24]|uniref:DNA polymerase I n=2 Tax=Katanobacteria TaxID=422282 RepID=A0A2G9XC75_UNCKA|nr:MAG: hypothetical protein AUJ94_01845 [bacterium CG2_30_40_12]OJI08187.1 MAG: hypothetical protein BK003_02980 [bacterium CG09_39_24]PIP04564.1 MAG: hypothetical protein COX53_01900 [candidate division WWE3 bacterium CG23_combo_of_CG06-09_8_20_14_all_40_14]PIS12629.1 MAG: hypothetical protein COT69_03135 [candidate division WWE3 bacterium CG09_land_8_20_14_0_10_39_24]PJE51969.1 MAG: hypothetical protein COV27_00910 [candidate division WWE3 bacterium CG10_big_fil_rev_8_21_14_0_10_39_14]